MLASQIPFVGTMGALIASNALKLKFIEAGKELGNSGIRAYQTEQRLGKWYHVVYLNGWTRREDVANQTVLIVKPDANQRIYLDLALQTYYTTPATDTAHGGDLLELDQNVAFFHAVVVVHQDLEHLAGDSGGDERDVAVDIGVVR